jgi:hypothetical protein
MDRELPNDFREFLRLLRDHRVEYLVIGGWAVGLHGYPRATNDLDIWIAISSTNAERVVGALHDFGFDSPDLSNGLFLEENRIIEWVSNPIASNS